MPDPVADAINTITEHLKEHDEQFKILFEKHEICLTDDNDDLDKIKIKK